MYAERNANVVSDYRICILPFFSRFDNLLNENYGSFPQLCLLAKLKCNSSNDIDVI